MRHVHDDQQSYYRLQQVAADPDQTVELTPVLWAQPHLSGCYLRAVRVDDGRKKQPRLQVRPDPNPNPDSFDSAKLRQFPRGPVAIAIISSDNRSPRMGRAVDSTEHRARIYCTPLRSIRVSSFRGRAAGVVYVTRS